jgi:hypothetical protein
MNSCPLMQNQDATCQQRYKSQMWECSITWGLHSKAATARQPLRIQQTAKQLPLLLHSVNNHKPIEFYGTPTIQTQLTAAAALKR